MANEDTVRTWTRKDGEVVQSRPPFEEGNKVALRHGVYSPERIRVEAQEVREALASHAELLGADIFAAEFEALCWEQAILNLAQNYIMGVVSGEIEAYPVKGRPTTGMEAVPERIWQARDRAAANAHKFRTACGMNAQGFVGLVKELGWAQHLTGGQVKDLLSKGAELRALRNVDG